MLGLFWSMFSNVVLHVVTITLLRNRQLVALLYLHCCCRMSVCVPCAAVSWHVVCDCDFSG